jgi:hypothetical protein
VDHWHNDSIAFAGVVVLSDMEGMCGGKLELFRGSREEGQRILRTEGVAGLAGRVETVGYEGPGRMILTQGAEVLHHVTPVTSEHVRQTLVFGLTPANAFQPPRTVLSSMVRVDWKSGIAPYEFYRAAAWQCSQVNCSCYIATCCVPRPWRTWPRRPPTPGPGPSSPPGSGRAGRLLSLKSDPSRRSWTVWLTCSTGHSRTSSPSLTRCRPVPSP